MASLAKHVRTLFRGPSTPDRDDGYVQLVERINHLPINLIEKGDHNVPLPPGIDTCFRSALAKQLLAAAKDSPRSERILKAVDLCVEREQAWTIRVERGVIKGNSHYRKGSVRAYTVTDWNTLALFIQPGEVLTVRECELSLPKCVGSVTNVLEDILDTFVPPLIRNRAMPATLFQDQLITVSRKHPNLVDRPKDADLRDFLVPTRSLNRRIELATLFGDAMCRKSREWLFSKEVHEIIRTFWGVYGRKTLRLDEVGYAHLFMAVTAELQLLNEGVPSKFQLGEYGQVLYARVVEEREIKRNEATANRRQGLEAKERRLLGNIQKTEEALRRQRLELDAVKQELRSLL